MSKARVERRLAAVLAADVVGYSRLMGADEEGTLTALKAYWHDVFDPKVAEHQGRIVKTMGDGALVEFASAVEAVRCALDIQRSNAERNAAVPKDRRIELRIGINIGDIIIDQGDIYGDGVNIAARIEPLAEPGAICFAENVYQQIKRKLSLNVTDMGEQSLKNIAQPVRVFQVASNNAATLVTTASSAQFLTHSARYGWRLALVLTVVTLSAAGIAWWQPWQQYDAPASLKRMAHPLPAKPSIAVLPFTNMSADPQQNYFADGMTEDLITDLSKIPELFVIARNSSFTYKGKSAKIQQVAEDLGVRYVLEGSVQRAGDRVRINAQLIDATSGGHLWAERYDGSMADVFGLQDKITQKIVSALTVKFGAKLPDGREKTASPQAYDAFLRGWEYYRRYSADDFSKAIPYFEQAIKLDPNYGRAYAALASIYWESFRQGASWISKVSPDEPQPLGAPARYKAQKYVDLALRKPSPLAYRVASALDWEFRQFDDAIAKAKTAITLDPNDPDGHVALAWALVFSGRAQEAVPEVEQAMRLDPLHPEIYASVLGMSWLKIGKLEDAVTILEKARKRNSQDRNANLLLTVAYERLGRHEDARIALQRYTAVWSNFSTSYVDHIMSWWPFKLESDTRSFGSSLVDAGLCCADRLERYIENLRQGGTLE